MQFADFSGAFGAGGKVDFGAIVAGRGDAFDEVPDGEMGKLPVGFGEKEMHGSGLEASNLVGSIHLAMDDMDFSM